MLRVELAAITHVLQARRYLEEIDAREPALVDQCVLFLTGTAEFGLDHLRAGRTVQPRSALSTGLPSATEHLIGGQIPLGVLADLAGMMLDALEAHFVLYDEEHGQLPVPEIPAEGPDARSRASA